jgi:hypothetical protein
MFSSSDLAQYSRILYSTNGPGSLLSFKQPEGQAATHAIASLSIQASHLQATTPVAAGLSIP